MNNQNQKQKSGEVKIVDNIPGAEYTNASQIRHNKEEFQMIFLNLMPPSGRVASKIVTTPGHFKRMVLAMKDNLKKYEEQFGEITEAKNPSDEIGFKG